MKRVAAAAALVGAAAATDAPVAYARTGDDGFNAETNMKAVASDATSVTFATNGNFKLAPVFAATATSASKLKDVYKKIETLDGKDTSSLVRNTAASPKDFDSKKLGVFDLDVSGLAEGKYVLDTTGSTLPAGTHKVKLVVDRTAPKGKDYTMTGKVYVGEGMDNAAIPVDKLFWDDQTVGTKMVVTAVTAMGPTHGIQPSNDKQWVGTTEVKGPGGNAVFQIEARDEAGNKAKATLTIPVYEKPKPAITIYDARGTSASSSAATYHTGASATKELTVVATFPEPVTGLTNTWLKVSSGTIATPTSSAGGRVWTGKVSFTSYPESPFKISVDKDVGTTVAQGLKTGASAEVTVTVDSTAPTATAKTGPKAVVGTPFSYPIKLDGSDAFIFADTASAVQDIQMVSATMDTDVGLSFTPGRQGAGAYVSGKATSVPTTECNGAKGVTFTITAKDKAGNSQTGTLCVPVLEAYAAGAATTPAMTFTNKALTFTDGDAAVALDAAATYTGPAASKVMVHLVTPDTYSSSAATAEKLTHATATVTYAQDKAGVGSYSITSGLTTAADVQAVLRGIKYENTLTAPTPGARTFRVFVYDANGGLAAFQTRTINVAAKNDLPVVKPIDAATWTEGDGEKHIVVFTTATDFITDADDTKFRSAVVSLARTAGEGTVVCDSDRDYLKLDESAGNGLQDFVGTWNAKTCQLVLKPTDAKAVSAARFRDALKAVSYGNKDAANPTNYAGTVKKLVSVTITDDASDNTVTVPATSAARTFELTVTPVDSAPVIDFPAAYGEDGFLFGTSRFGQTESFVDGKGNTITHRRFVAAVDTSSSDALTLEFSFDLAKKADGVFGAANSITDADDKDLNDGYNAGIVCATTMTSESGECSDIDVSDVTFEDGKLTFKVTADHQSALTSLVGTTKYFQFLYGSDSDQVSANFGVQFMEKKCAAEATFDGTKHIPTPEACYNTDGTAKVTATAVNPRDTNKATIKSTAWTANAADLDAAAEAQAATGAPFDEQVEAMRSLRQKSRGTYAVEISAGSFTTAQASVDVLALPPAKKIVNALPPAADAEHKVDTDVALQLSPAGTKFTKPVKVCVHVGDADAGYEYKFAIASEVDPLVPAKGFGPWEDLIDQTYDPRTGRLCGYTSHFSVAAPVLVPVPVDPTQQKKFQMGGSCPNDCSNKGMCRENGKCACFQGFGGYDCSARTCPAAESWDTADGIVHKPAECSNRGACDAKTGACACYKGFEGSACQRVSCPNDCSGNGKCRFLSELPKTQQAGYSSWEASRIQVCQCDGGYTGPDCSQRLCPFGDDPETVCNDDARQVQSIKLEFVSPPEVPSVSTNDELALSFTTATGSNFTTFRVENVFDASNGAASLTNALKALPMFAVSDVSVSGTATTNDITWKITFDDSDRSLAHLFSSTGSPTGAAGTVSGNTVAGNQALLQCPTLPGTNFLAGCQGAGCRPQFKQLRMEKVTGAGATINPNAILSQPARADGAFPSTWGVEVTVTIATVNGQKTYKVDSSVYGGGVTPSDAIAAQLLPPAGLRKAVPLVYGLVVDFDDADANIPDGSIVFKWLLPTCTVAQEKAADPDFESLECSRRGVCDRKTGECSCFNGYTGVSCSQQTVIV